MEGRLPQGFDLHLEVLGRIKVLVADRETFLLFQRCQLLSNRIQTVNGIFDLLC